VEFETTKKFAFGFGGEYNWARNKVHIGAIGFANSPNLGPAGKDWGGLNLGPFHIGLWDSQRNIGSTEASARLAREDMADLP
jgi:hypothetical protein